MGVRVREKRAGSSEFWVFVASKGQRTSRLVGDREAAETAATVIQAKLTLGDRSIFDPPAPIAPTPEPEITLREYAREWRKNYTGLACKQTTLGAYESNLDLHILPALGDRPLKSITRRDCKNLIAACLAKPRTRKLTASTDPTAPVLTLAGKPVKNVIRTLSSLLSAAVEDGLIDSNPALNKIGRFCKDGRIKPKINPFTREEARAFLAAVKVHAPREQALFMTALRAGLRLGELFGLEWGDLDVHGHFIEVRRNRSGGQVTTPKNGESRRVDMSDQLAETFQRLRVERKVETLKRGWGQVPETVFVTEAGRPYDAANLRQRIFYRTLAKAGIRRVRLHDLRHTYASLLIQQRESLAYVRDQMGHSSIKVTVDTYGHLVPGANRQAVNRLDDSSHPAQGINRQAVNRLDELAPGEQICTPAAPEPEIEARG
jgi:integrase